MGSRASSMGLERFAIAFYLSYRLSTGNVVASSALRVVAGGVMYAPYAPDFAFILNFLPRNVAGVGIGAINAFGALPENAACLVGLGVRVVTGPWCA